MNKKTASLILLLALIIPIGVVFAQETTNPQEQAKQVMEAQREANKKAMETQREGNKQAIETQREGAKQAMEAQREVNKQTFEGLKQANRLEFQDRKEKMAAEQCKNIENKIANRVNRYENNGQMLEKVYGNMQTRLERLLARLKSANADTTQLEKDLATLYAKIDTLKADQASFMTTLQESQAFVCGKSEGEFKGKIDQARKVPETIKTDRENIKNFFETTIKADLELIKSKLAAQKEAVKTETPEVKPTPVQ